MIYGARVREVRELRDLGQAQLAELVGVERSAIAHIEAGRHQPSEEVLAAIALHTGFPRSFFEDEETVDFPLGTLLFRARADMTARQCMQAHRYGELIYRRARMMASRLAVPPVRIPQLEISDPHEAAQHTRAALGLSAEGPIAHLTNTLERAGVFVLALPLSLPKRDAFSLWVGDDARPVIVVVNDVPGDRLRFSLAHEVGHLVRRPAGPVDINTVEKGADWFASALLLPAEAMRREMVSPVTLGSLAELKPRWGVSIQALIRRGYALGVLSLRQKNYLFEQLGKRGWRTHEPDNLSVPVERPRAVRKMAEMLYGEPIDYVRMAEDLHLQPHFLRQIVEAHGGREDLPSHPDKPGAKILPFRRLPGAANLN